MRLLIIAILGLGAGLISCDQNGGLDKTNNFDQQPFLQNIGENIILPAYAALAEENRLLEDAIDALSNDVSETTLEAAQDQLKAARLAWQACTPYQFGPAEMYNLRNELNIYPVDQSQIESNISSGDYDLSTLSNLDSKGYPAIEFLLHSPTDESVTVAFTADRLDYLEAVVSRMVTVSEQVHTDWSPTGENYLATFTSESALGVDVGSSTGQLVNAMNLDFERNTRDGKVGIPVGIRSLGEAIPERAEAYFSGYSVELLKANMVAYRKLFTGGEGIGFEDYLNEIGASTTGNEELAKTMLSQFDKVDNAIAAISDPLPEAIASQKEDVERIFAEMQGLVVLFKTDMASSLGVVITYQDTDGD